MSNEMKRLRKSVRMFRILSLDDLSMTARIGNEVLFQSRGGTLLERIFAGVGIMGTVGRHMFPQGGAPSMALRSGLKQVSIDQNLLGFMVSILQTPVQPPSWVRSVGQEDVRAQFTIWGDYDVALLEWPNAPQGHFHLRPQFYARDPESVCKLLSDSLWGREDNIHGFKMVIDEDSKLSGFSQDFRVVPNPHPGEYVGDDLPERALGNLQNELGDMGRVLLLVGPTGTGKTVFAHKVVSGWPGNGHRILKVSGESIKTLTPQSISVLAKFLQPTVLLLDDIPFGGDNGEKYLDLFDSLRGNMKLVLATYMNEDVKGLLSGDPGSLYWPGMRPGRVDEIMVIPPPDKNKREAILKFYLRDSNIPEGILEPLLKATEGFTGAFLQEFAHRVTRRGWDCWEAQVQNLKCQAPAQLFGGEAPEPKKKKLTLPFDQGKPNQNPTVTIVR